MFHLIRFNQDVWLGSEVRVDNGGVSRGVFVDHGPGRKYHSKGDMMVVTDLYRRDLDRDGVSYYWMDSMTKAAHKELLMGIKAKRMGLVAKGGV